MRKRDESNSEKSQSSISAIPAYVLTCVNVHANRNKHILRYKKNRECENKFDTLQSF